MSNIHADVIADAAGTGPATLTGQTAAKAWCNHTAITTTAVNDSFNVSSVTDEGVGATQVNFTNNFSDVEYCATGVVDNFCSAVQTPLVGSADFIGYYVSSLGGGRALYDITRNYSSYTGDLA